MQVDDINGTSNAFLNIADIYIEKQDVDSAQFCLDNGMKYANQVHAKQLLMLSYHLTSRLDSLKGDYQSAYLNYKKYKLTSDSISSAEVIKQIHELELKFDKLKKEEEIARQKTQIENQKKIQKLWIAGFILVSFLLIVVVFFIIRFIKANQLLKIQSDDILQKNKILEQQKEEITAANEELKATNEALYESEERFRAISDMSPVGLIVSDKKGYNIYSNSQNEKISGLNTEETLGLGWAKVIHPDDKQKILNKLAEWRNSESADLSLNYRYIHAKTGNTVWVDTKIAKLYVDEQILGFVGVVEDITERIKKEEELKLSRNTLHKVLNNIEALVYVVDFETCEILFANDAFKRAFGTDKGRCSDVIYGHEHCKECMAKELIISESQHIEFPVAEYHNPNNNRDYQINESAILWIDKRFVRIAFATDITERKIMEATIRKQKEEIEKQNRDLTDSIFYAKRIQEAMLPPAEYINYLIPDNFLIYHPRDIISGDYYWIKEFKEKIFVVAADCTGHGVPGAFMSLLGITSLNEIINSNSKQNNINSAEILNKLRSKVINSLRQTGLSGESKDGMDLSLCVIDFRNNSIEFSGANNSAFILSKSVSGEILTKELKANKMPIGYRTKNDPSFSKIHYSFQGGEMLYMFSDGYRDQFGGLKGRKFLKKNFIKLLESNFEKPVPEQKSIIEDTFKNWIAPKEIDKLYKQIDDVLVFGIRLNKIENIENTQENDYKGALVLLADDEKDSYFIMKTFLAELNINVIWAKDGEEAIELFKANDDIKLVLMDVMMPYKNGIEATQHIKAHKNIPIIMQTAFASSEDKEKAFKAGCDDYLSKPILKSELYNKIHKFLKV